MARKKIRLDDNNIDLRFQSKAKDIVQFIQPKDVYLVLGRGAAKTSDIVAERSMDIIRDMPRSFQLFLSSTYMDAMTNVVPSLIEGWQRKGWIEGIHFVTDKRPKYGKNFAMPYKPLQNFKHTISLYNGTVIIIGSTDQPSGLAGNSYQHRYVDEARLIQKKKLDRSTPALRGEYLAFGHSIYYMGNTVTTDMPNLLLGDHDWILSMEKEMDKERIQLILEVSLTLNDIKKEILANNQMGVTKDFARLKKLEKIWTENYHRVRKGSLLYHTASSYVNADILTADYYKNVYTSLGPEEYRSAICSFPVTISKGEKFYVNLGPQHFYDNGDLFEYYQKYEIKDLMNGEKIEDSSISLRYIQHDKKIEIGIDFGDMMSMVVGQSNRDKVYILKEFYTLAPDNEQQLGKKFREYFKYHKRKEVDMYYDRSGNQYSKVKRDWASDLKKEIEFDESGAKVFTVNLMSEEQATIYQEEEYQFAKNIFSEKDPLLPRILIDELKCPCLKSSLELSKIKVKKNLTGSSILQKDKSSESLPLASRPMFSTNFSDAFKYFMMRKIHQEKMGYVSEYVGEAPMIL
jgi:hypothetical protein